MSIAQLVPVWKDGWTSRALLGGPAKGLAQNGTLPSFHPNESSTHLSWSSVGDANEMQQYETAHDDIKHLAESPLLQLGNT